MKKQHRALALLMAALLCLGLLPAAALAGEAPEADAPTLTEEAPEADAPTQTEEAPEADAPTQTEEPPEADAPTQTEEPPEAAEPAEDPQPAGAVKEPEPAEDAGEPAVEAPDQEALSEEPSSEAPAEEPAPAEPEALPAADGEEAAEGACGASVTWSYDPASKVLVLQGSGATFDNYNSFPYTVKANAETISVEGEIDRLGAALFSGFSGVKAVRITAPLTALGDKCFYNCTALKSLDLLPGLETVGEYCFYGAGLESIHFPDTVTAIGSNTFANCRALKEVTLPDGLQEIPVCMFLYCESLPEVQIPDSVTVIGQSAFSGCKALRRVVIPDSVTSAGNSSFYQCTALQQVTIGRGLQRIEKNMFSGCSSLNDLTIPETVTRIEGSAFTGCQSLMNITGGEGVAEVGLYAFNDTPWLRQKEQESEFITLNGVLFRYTGDGAFVNVPEGVTRIGEKAFTNVTLTGNIILPDSLEYINDNAFNGQKELTAVGFGPSPSLKWIGRSAFCASGLRNIELPDTVCRIEEQSFASCAELEYIYLPLSLTRIGRMVCSWCDKLSKVYYGGSEKTWQDIEIYTGNDVLLNAERQYMLEEAVSPAENRDVRDGSVIEKTGAAGDSAAWTLRSSGLLTVSGTGATYAYQDLRSETNPFYANRQSITRVEIEPGVTEIGRAAFNNMMYLYGLSIADTVKTIGDYAFASNENMTRLHIPDSVTSIGSYAFGGWRKLTDLRLGSGLKELGSSAFSNAAALTSLTLPDSLETIGESAFSDCRSMTWIAMGKNVKSIGMFAFDGCDSLTDVFYAGTEAEWNAIHIDMFNDPLKNAQIHFETVPADEDGVVDPHAAAAILLGQNGLDMDGNGAVDRYDAVLVLKALVGLFERSGN